MINSVALANAGTVQSLRLMLQGNPALNTITARYEAYFAASVVTGELGTYSPPNNVTGYFFGTPSNAGIMTTTGGGAAFTVTYQNFVVLPGTDCYFAALPTFTFGKFVPNNSVTSSSSAASSATGTHASTATGSATHATNTATGVPSSVRTGTVANPTEVGTSDSPTGNQGSATSPQECGESTVTEVVTTRPQDGSTQAATGEQQKPSSASSVVVPVLVALILAVLAM